jgi:ribulose-phosphate 3-epimerase
MAAVKIVPSVLPADFARFGEEVVALERAGCDRIQFDVMDGQFVPNLTFGPDLIAAARKHTTLPFEAHLMVLTPMLLAHRYVDAGCERLIVHAESVTHLHGTLDQVRALGVAAAVALNPATPAGHVAHVLDLVDMVLVMTVNPGFGGQKYLPSMEPKIAEVRALIEASGHDIEVEVDGGIDEKTIVTAAAAGATVFVTGTSLYAHPDGLAAGVATLRSRAEAASA